MKKSVTLLLAGFAAAAALGTAPASAATQGRLVLTTDAGVSYMLTYAGCAQPSQSVGANGLATFQNTPAPGCAVSLRKGTRSHVLCVGSGPIPAAFRDGATIRVQQGAGFPCR
ncbi:hypothetical protein ACIBHY_21940 [Nonomuraea sp. NPDC050547]|uniref:hypothetical protein n=1 Tax=Nonomuraea sp. NPDC050547 TaxID=3364368 RepID=UPI0037881C60